MPTKKLAGGRGWLRADAADSIARMDAARGRRVQITEAGRTRARQLELLARWRKGGKYNRPPYLYQPAEHSPHELGTAIDSNDQAFLLSTGRSHGWRRDVPSDLVHFVYHPTLDTHRPKPAPPKPAQIKVDGLWGPATTRSLQRELGVKVDGIRGWGTIRALQKRLGLAGTGAFTLGTRKALQRHLHVTADGVIGPVTTKALQRRLNAGTF